MVQGVGTQLWCKPTYAAILLREPKLDLQVRRLFSKGFRLLLSQRNVGVEASHWAPDGKRVFASIIEPLSQGGAVLAFTRRHTNTHTPVHARARAPLLFFAVTHLNLQGHEAQFAPLVHQEALGQVDVLAPLLREELHHELAVHVELVAVEVQELLN